MASEPLCRICTEGAEAGRLVRPCDCTGSVGVIHETCLCRWIESRSGEDRLVCEICGARYRVREELVGPPADEVRSSSDRDKKLALRRVRGMVTFALVVVALSAAILASAVESPLGMGPAALGGLFTLAAFLYSLTALYGARVWRHAAQGPCARVPTMVNL